MKFSDCKPARYTLFLTVLLYLLPATAHADFVLKSWLDRNKIAEGETVTLIITAEGKILPQYNLDLSPLKANFHMTLTENKTQQRIVNGKASSRRVWKYSLQPKKSGQLTIPALQAGKQQTQPLQLTVTPRPKVKTAAGNRPPVFIDASVNRTTVPVRGQLLYIIQVGFSISIRGQVGEPKLSNNTPVRKIKESKYRKTIGSSSYSIHEWRYAIFPQKSGKFTIPATNLSAIYNRRRHQYHSQAITVDVLPIPAGFGSATWLPAESLEIREEWDAPIDQPHIIGQPLTRELKIVSQGLLAEQLPVLEIDDIPGVKIYTEQANLKNHNRHEGVRGVRSETIVMIPTRLGTIELPPIEISWWNIEQGGLETTVIPGRSIEVVADTEPQLTLEGESQDSIVTAAGQVSASSLLSDQQAEYRTKYLPLWLLLLTIAGFSAWPLLLWLWWRERRKQLLRIQSESHAARMAADNINLALDDVGKACRSRNASKAQLALMRWGQLCWPEEPPRNLRELAERSDSQALMTAIDNLIRRLYRDETKHWDGALLYEALAGLKKAGPTDRVRNWWQRKNTLPDLYQTAGGQ